MSSLNSHTWAEKKSSIPLKSNRAVASRVQLTQTLKKTDISDSSSGYPSHFTPINDSMTEISRLSRNNEISCGIIKPQHMKSVNTQSMRNGNSQSDMMTAQIPSSKHSQSRSASVSGPRFAQPTKSTIATAKTQRVVLASTSRRSQSVETLRRQKMIPSTSRTVTSSISAANNVSLKQGLLSYQFISIPYWSLSFPAIIPTSCRLLISATKPHVQGETVSRNVPGTSRKLVSELVDRVPSKQQLKHGPASRIESPILSQAGTHTGAQTRTHTRTHTGAQTRRATLTQVWRCLIVFIVSSIILWLCFSDF